MFEMNTASKALRKVAREKLTVPAVGWSPTAAGASSEDCVVAAYLYWDRTDTGERDSISVLYGELRARPAGR